MTVTEVRDRLNDRFRLLVGSRRGLERHQTLRHAVQWSYDLLDRGRADAAEPVLGVRRRLRPGGRVCGSRLRGRVRHAGSTRCPGAQVASGCRPVVGPNPVLDAGDHSPVRRRSARRRWPGRGGTRCARATTSRACEADVVALWDSPRQREAYDWFTSELANLRTAFRWAADRGDLDTAATIAHLRIHWSACRAIRTHRMGRGAHRSPPKPSNIRRLAALYVVACQCCWVGRIDEAIRYSEMRQRLIGDKRFDRLPLRLERRARRSLHSRRPAQRWADVARHQLEHTTTAMDTSRAALTDGADARWAAYDEAIGPHGRSRRRGRIHRTTHFHFAERFLPSVSPSATPIRAPALRALGSALEVAQDSGNRFNESHIAVVAVPARSATRLTQRPHSTTSRWRSATTSTRVTSRPHAVRWPSSPACWIGLATMSLRPPSPNSPQTH